MLRVNDRVICRFYNTPEGKFYGDEFEATIREIKQVDYPKIKQFLVECEKHPEIWLHRKEIKRKIS